MSQFWAPEAVQGYQASNDEEFIASSQSYDIELRPVPSRLHRKSPLQPEHGVVRSIYLRMRSNESNKDNHVLEIRAVRISNDSY